MKNYRLLYKETSIKKYLTFTFLFFFVMYLSKSLQVLWFDENNSLGNFGISYSAMALAGAISFLVSPIINRKSGANPLKIPLVIYGIGMALRIFTHSPVIAAVSGFVAGIGASTTLNAFRGFLAQQSKKENFELLLSQKNVLQQSASALGASAMGLMLAAFAFSNHGFELSLMVCAITMMLLFLLWPQNDQSIVQDQPNKRAPWRVLLKEHSFRTAVLVGFSLLTGISVSCVAPFLVVALKRQGLSISHIGMLVGSGVFIGAATQTLVTPLLKTKHYLAWFAVFEILLAIMTALLVNKGLSVWIVSAIYFARLFVLSISTFLQEALEFKILPENYSAEILATMQSFFLLGDMIGGSVGGFIAQDFGVETILKFGATLFAVNGVLFVSCIHILKRKQLYVESQQVN